MQTVLPTLLYGRDALQIKLRNKFDVISNRYINRHILKNIQTIAMEMLTVKRADIGMIF